MLDRYFTSFEDFLLSGDPGSLAAFTDTDTDPAFWRVYRNGYLKTCTDSLKASYPVVCAMVGEDYFRGLARAYVEENPPTTGTLVGYGSDFAAFLRARPDAQDLPYLADSAAIDAAWLASFFAADGMPLSATDVEQMGARGVDVATVGVVLTPPTQRIELRHQIADVWAEIRDRGRLDHKVSVEAKDNQVMLWRLQGQIHIRQLDVGEAAFLAAVEQGTTLAAAADAAFVVDPEFDLAATFAALLQNAVLQMENPKA